MQAQFVGVQALFGSCTDFTPKQRFLQQFCSCKINGWMQGRALSRSLSIDCSIGRTGLSRRDRCSINDLRKPLANKHGLVHKPSSSEISPAHQRGNGCMICGLDDAVCASFNGHLGPPACASMNFTPGCRNIYQGHTAWLPIMEASSKHTHTHIRGHVRTHTILCQ